MGPEFDTKADFPARLQCGEPGHGSQLRHQSGPKLRGGVEGTANGLADIGFFGPVTYTQAKERGGAELLAVGVEKGQSVYCSALFVRANSPIKTIADLKGKRAAFGDVNSSSSSLFSCSTAYPRGSSD